MNNGLRLTGFFCVVGLLAGCADERYGPQSMDAQTYYGAFNQIVSEVENLQSQVNVDAFQRDYNPVEDQLTAAIHFFKKNEEVKGTPLEAEAQKLLDLTAQIEELWQSPDGSVGEIRVVAAEMQDQVEHMKEMMK